MTESTDVPAVSVHSLLMVLLSQRALFLVVAVFLLVLTTNRFSGDLPAFFWSLIVLTGVVYLDD